MIGDSDIKSELEFKNCQSSYLKKFGIRYNKRKIDRQRLICGSCGKTYSIGSPKRRSKTDQLIYIRMHYWHIKPRKQEW